MAGGGSGSGVELLELGCFDGVLEVDVWFGELRCCLWVWMIWFGCFWCLIRLLYWKDCDCWCGVGVLFGYEVLKSQCDLGNGGNEHELGRTGLGICVAGYLVSI